MEVGSVVGSIDVAQVTLYAFWIFFAGLIWYIRQEDRREGYPLEDDVTGRYSKDPWLFVPSAKTFVLGQGQGSVSVPDLARRDGREVKAVRTARFPGAPLRPTGDPLADGVGPGSWAERADVPDLTAEGTPRIVPMHIADGFAFAEDAFDPTGARVVACDSKVVGRVTGCWVDRSECLIRYLQVALDAEDGAKSVVVSMNFSAIKRARAKERFVYVHALASTHFAAIPQPASAERITRLEEERIVAYFGGGQLYATPARQETIL